MFWLLCADSSAITELSAEGLQCSGPSRSARGLRRLGGVSCRLEVP